MSERESKGRTGGRWDRDMPVPRGGAWYTGHKTSNVIS